jgi:hypothetical protein
VLEGDSDVISRKKVKILNAENVLGYTHFAIYRVNYARGSQHRIVAYFRLLL